MNAARFAYLAVVALTALAAAHQTQAQTFGRHPAIRGAAPAAVASIDPNTFIVAHPAGLALRGGHANYAHPAELLSRQTAPAPDPNHFLVQPPASVHWATGPVDDLAVATAR